MHSTTPERREAFEEELHALEARFHTLVDAITDYAIFMLDASGHVATWNAGARRTKGYEEAEIVGKHFSVFYTPEDRAADKPAKVLEAVRRDGRFEDESWRIRKDGSRFWANVVITALRDRTGQIYGFAKITRDLTAKRAAEREAEENERKLISERLARAATEAERRRLLTLLEQVPAIVNYLRGADFVLELVHPRALARFGGDDAVGKPLLVAAPELRGERYHQRVQQAYATGEALSDAECVERRQVDGRPTESYWNNVYLPVRDAMTGRVEGVMTFELDVTDYVRAREALQAVSQENARAREELEALNRTKDEFLATMSHELRTPLNAIYGWATLLRKNLADPAKLARGLEVIERNAQAQTRLVSDLLDVSRIVSGKLQLYVKRVELAQLIREAADVVRPAADAKGLRLLVDVDPDLGATLADPDRLHQVLWNLLINAVRFTPRGGRIVFCGDRLESRIVLTVRDTGAGITAEHLPHIFERFRQVDSSLTRTHGGLGLGLAIVRHIVEAHGGSVHAQSEGVGQGTTVTVNLPIGSVDRSRVDVGDEALHEPRKKTPERTPGPTLQGVSVLAIDDDVDSLELLRTVLEDADARVTTCSRASEAISWLERERFDVIISDIGMPEMDGYSFIEHVRARSASHDTPAIALTAYARSVDALRAKQAGFQAHLAKPVQERELLDAVRTLVPLQRS